MKYRDLLLAIPEKEGTRVRYMTMLVEVTQERVIDIIDVDRLERTLKIGRNKILELIELRKKINN